MGQGTKHKLGVFFFMYKPTWQKHEKDMKSLKPKEAEKALNAFIEEREKELQNNPSARQYEKSRRESLAKDKPQWVKEKRAKESEEYNSTLNSLKSLKKGGSYQYMIKPSPGYVLVQPDEQEKEKIISGIIIATDIDEKGNNTGKVISVGGELALAKTVMQPPVQENDLIMYKWFAGMDVNIKGENMKLMQFTDILGRFEK